MIRYFTGLLACIVLLAGCANPVVNVPGTVLYANDKAQRAIVFIHGLNGHPLETWRNPETGAVWHEMLSSDRDLPSDIKVISVSYNASLLSSNLSLQEMARSLKADLRVNRLTNDGPFKEIYFIAHSMGNLVLRALLAEEPELFRGVRIPLIISMGAPSSGSDLAALGKWLIPGNPQLENLSSANNQYLTDLNKQWASNQGDTRISCGYETVITSGLGMIVSATSAQSVCNGTLWPIAANHSFMVKPRDRQDRIYAWTKDEIKAITRSMDARGDIQFVNAYGKSSVTSVPLPDKPAQRQGGDITVANILEATNGISIIDISSFLIDMIPKVEGGITCMQLTEMAVKASIVDRGDIVSKASPHVRRPLDDGCIARVRRIVSIIDADGAIRSLLQPVRPRAAPVSDPSQTPRITRMPRSSFSP